MSSLQLRQMTAWQMTPCSTVFWCTDPKFTMTVNGGYNTCRPIVYSASTDYWLVDGLSITEEGARATYGVMWPHDFDIWPFDLQSPW